MNPEELKQFDEKFPATQKESTHFDDCKCWSCNNYRESVLSFISSLIATRERVWRERVVKEIDERKIIKRGEYTVLPHEPAAFNQGLSIAITIVNRTYPR